MAKVIKVYGKTLEELKAMDWNDVVKLLPTRLRRTITRANNNKKHEPLQKKINAALEGKRKKPIKTHHRDFIITPQMVGMTLKVYNGKEFRDVVIIEPMIGHVLGEFALTRKHGNHSGPGVGATKSSRAAKK